MYLVELLDNGKVVGYQMGDILPHLIAWAKATVLPHQTYTYRMIPGI